MAKTVVALFDSFGDAQRALDDLLRFGVRREDISLVARDEHGTQEREVGESAAAEGAGAGAVGGSLVGGALGLLVGTGLLVIPGIGPVLAAGPLAAGIGTIAAAAGATALGAGIGAAAGGLFGGLLGAGVPEDEAQAYVEGVRRGGTLLSVRASDVEADDIRQVMLRNGAIDIDRRAEDWRAAGWNGDNGIDTTAAGDDNSIPRGDSYSISGHQAANDYQDSSKAGTVTGTVAGAATGATIGAAGGPLGSVVGGIAGAVTGGAAGAAGDVAGERAEDAADRGYRFKDGDLNDVDRKVVDSSYTSVDRSGDRQKDSGFASGHTQPERQPEAYDEFLAQDERNFRTPEDTRSPADSSALTDGDMPYRGAGFNAIDRNEKMGRADTMADVDNAGQSDTMSESGRRSPQYAGADQMGGAIGNMALGSGSAQPGREAATPGGRRVRIYDNNANRSMAGQAASDEQPLPAHGDFARGMRDEPAPAVEPDYARGMHSGTQAGYTAHEDSTPHHGDFARGMRQEESASSAPDYARGQRSFELHDADFIAHHRTMLGAGGQPYDYYKPGYQFGYDLASAPGYTHDSWEAAERDARTSWERENRNDWEEFKDTIRYGWEKARGRR